MGDQIQHQLAKLVNLFQEERAANIARQEAINARLDALTKDLANSKVDIIPIKIGAGRVKVEW